MHTCIYLCIHSKRVFDHLLLLLLFSCWVVSDSLRPMDCTTPGFRVLHHLPELAQTHVHWVCDAFQSSCPLWFPSPPALNLSQHQGLFQWVDSSHQVAKVLELPLASASVLPVNIQGWFPLGWTGLISLQSEGVLRVFSNTTVWKHQFFGAKPFLLSSSHICTRLLEKP